MSRYLVNYICEDHANGYNHYDSEIVYNVAEWAIDVKSLKKTNNITCTCLSIIEMTDEQSSRWLDI